MQADRLPFAVIGNGEVITASPAGIVRRPYPTMTITSAGDLAAIALTEALPLRAIWLDPTDRYLTEITDAGHPGFWDSWNGYHVWATGVQGGGVSSAQVRRDDARGAQRREVSIFADLPRRWGLECGGPILANVILHYEQAMTVEARYSPAQTALALLKELNTFPTRPGWLAPLSATTLESLPMQPAAPPLHVNRTPRDGGYIHVYDKNAAYIAACKHGYGTGEPRHLTTISDDLHMRIVAGKVYGCWRISAQPLAVDPRATPLPSVWGRGMPIGDQFWCYSPHLSLAAQSGWHITIHEGYAWLDAEGKSTARPSLLGDWADHLWDARQRVKGSQTEALLKRSFVQARGVMTRPPMRDDQESLDPQKIRWYHRPDWSATMVAEHYLRQVKQIQAYEKAIPGYLYVDTDAIGWVSDDPNPATALPGVLDRAHMKGGYKHTATLSGDAAHEVIDMARAGLALVKIVGAVKTLAEGGDDGSTTRNAAGRRDDACL